MSPTIPPVAANVMPGMPEALRPAWAPLAILALATALAWLGPPLPESLAGLRALGPYGVLIAAAALCAWFNRGRALVLALSMLAAFAGWRLALDWGEAGFAARAAGIALGVLVPANALLALVLPERGVRHPGSWRWLALLGAEAALVAWIGASGRSDLSGAAWQGALEHWALRSPPVPLVVRLAFAAAFAAAAWRAWPEHRPLEVGVAGALALFFIACAWLGDAAAFAIFVSAAGAALLVALLQESHRMAFRDALTGLPNRRALEEALHTLGPGYTLAMADVDHFKQFNDVHGHDIGDQVLKLVGARLAEVGGGGRAFRYGGEEFTLLFAGKDLEEVLPHLEAVRAAVERHRVALRAEDRPRDGAEGAKQRGGRAPGEALAVTISIGAAAPRGLEKPGAVLKAADEALYRAKQGGRNRLSR